MVVNINNFYIFSFLLFSSIIYCLFIKILSFRLYYKTFRLKTEEIIFLRKNSTLFIDISTLKFSIVSNLFF